MTQLTKSQQTQETPKNEAPGVAPVDFTGLSDSEVKEQSERVRAQVAFRVDAHIAEHRGRS